MGGYWSSFLNKRDWVMIPSNCVTQTHQVSFLAVRGIHQFPFSRPASFPQLATVVSVSLFPQYAIIGCGNSNTAWSITSYCLSQVVHHVLREALSRLKRSRNEYSTSCFVTSQSCLLFMAASSPSNS
eukprot:scaffold1350_cov249-Pinguiococcus_pyrenoidosus.AAC.19